MRIENLPQLISTASPTLHPAGARALVAASNPSFVADSYLGQLWEVSAERRPRLFTRGYRDSAAQFSPDGDLVAFLRAAPGQPAQLYVVEAAGGEPVCVTDQKMGVSDFLWTPDSAALVFAASQAAEGRYGTMEGVSPGQEDPRSITDFQFEANGVGYTADQLCQIFVVDLPDLTCPPAPKPAGRALAAEADLPAAEKYSAVPPARALAKSTRGFELIGVSPDGALVYATGREHESADTDLRTDIYALPMQPDSAGEACPARNLTAGSPPRSFYTAVVSGETVWALGIELGADGRDFIGRNTGLYVAAAVGGDSWEALRRVTDEESIHLLHPLRIWPASGADGAEQVVTIEISHGSYHLVAVTKAGALTRLTPAGLSVTGISEVVGERVAYTYSSPVSPGEVGLLNLAAAVPAAGRHGDGAEPPSFDLAGVVAPGQCSDFGASLAEAPVIAQVRTYESADGYPVHGWVYQPAGPGPHPVLLNIHGGPFAGYAHAFFDEAQAYVEAGYAVVMCNPRGSYGYGQAHGQAVREQLGGPDMADIVAFLDGALAEFPALDASRQGIMGGSYGGFMTAWIISHTDRFKGAIVERGYLDPPSFIGSSDIGWFFSAAYTGEKPEQMQAQSPFARVGKVSTPALILHSEQDLRCPLDQAKRYYTALKLRGVPTEMLIFPGENHELSRSGTPTHRRQRFAAILEWWAKYL